METKTVTAKLRGEKYERYEGGGYFRRTYKGTLLNVLRAIATAHSYGFEEEHNEKQLLDAIAEQNGDGCDYIEELTIDGKVEFQAEGWDGAEDKEISC